MRTRKFRRIPETIALALCVGILLAAWAPANAQAYLIRPGDSLWKISRYFGVSIDTIKEVNDLDSNKIQAEEVLEIPEVHTVQPGDNLSRLEQKYGVSIITIMRANDLKVTTIKVGQKLTIPNEEITAVAETTAKTEALQNKQSFSVTDQELELLARAVYSEARGEPFKGQVAIAAVILNRVEDSDFPNTISGVIYEPWAFTAVNDGQFWLTPDATAYAAVREALAGSDPSDGAVFYYNPETATNQWIRSRPIVVTIGSHVFSF